MIKNLRGGRLVAITLLGSGLLAGGPATMAAPTAQQVAGLQAGEPNLRVAPDGTIYINAYADTWRSTDNGVTFKKINPVGAPLRSATSSDGAIDVAPDGRLWFTWATPNAGNTSVCTSHDRGDNWSCNYLAVPGATDRMWIAATPTGAELMTGEGLSQVLSFQTVTVEPPVFKAVDTTSVLNAGQTGDFARRADGGWEVINTGGDTVLDVGSDGVSLSQRPTNLPWSIYNDGMASLAIDPGQNMYGLGKDASGLKLGYAPSPTSDFTHVTSIVTSGTASFAHLATGQTGHVSVIYYWTADATVTANSLWKIRAAESFNANSANPTWTITDLDSGYVHKGLICSTLSCSTAGGNGRFAGDFLAAWMTPAGITHYAWINDTLLNQGLNYLHK